MIDSRPQPTTAEILSVVRDPNCEKCPLSSEGASTICMMGDGPIPARLAIVGEAPGWNEDREGVPFVGGAGQLLNKMLAEVGIDRAEVFVTNVNRCRPAANRTPTRKEQKACRPYLDAELGLVKPEVVLLLGNSALQGVLGMSGILSKRGAAVEKDGRAVIPTVHPAAVLRDPSYEQFLRADLLAVKRLLDGTNEPPVTDVSVPTTPVQLDNLLSMLNDAIDPIAFDVETDRLEWWHPRGRLDTVAFSWLPGAAHVTPLEHPEADWTPLNMNLWRRLDRALDGHRLIGHNVKFDLHWLHSRGIDGYAWFDTLVAAHLLDENRSNGLKPLARTLLGADLYEKDVTFKAGEAMDLTTLATYNGKDADYTLRLWHIFRGQLNEQPRLRKIFTHLSMPALRALCDIERVGMPVDVDRLNERHADINRRIAALENDLLQYVESDSPIFEPPNYNSSAQLADLLFNKLGLPVQATSVKTDKPSTDKATLHALRNAHPVVPLLREYRRLVKWRGTYTQNWLDRLAAYPDEQFGPAVMQRIYPNYNITGTVTGRLSGDMQQVPRDPFIRTIFGGVPGNVIIEADYSQIELRVAAMISGDTAMQEAYKRGDDLHTLTASAITGKPATDITKQDRQTAKSANFGLLYGMGWRGFRDYSALTYGVEMGDGEAQATRNAFFGRYPGLVYWHERMKRLVRAQGYVDSPIGRRRRLPAINSSDKDMAAEAERQAINSPVQGFASDLTLMAMVLLHQSLLKLPGRIIGQVHDSLLIECPEDEAEHVAALAKRTMEQTVPAVVRQVFDYTLPVPVVAEVKIGTHWGEA